jgi:hypothetical protein
VPSAIYAYMSPPTTTHLAIIPASVFVTSILYWRNLYEIPGVVN